MAPGIINVRVSRAPAAVCLGLALMCATAAAGSLRGDVAPVVEASESSQLAMVRLAEASYCTDTATTSKWTCATCDSGVTVTADIYAGGGRALVGYDANLGTLFVSYRGSSNIRNWIDNIDAFFCAPFSDLPEVEVESGFYDWYSDLNDGTKLSVSVPEALSSAASQYGTTKVTITGHSAGGACATLLAFEVARGYVSGFTVASVMTFGSPRVGNPAFASAHEATGLKSTRVTHWYDMVPHLPQEVLGYYHVSTENWWNEPNSVYTVCDGSGEDPSCSDSCGPTHCTSIDDHLYYINTTMGGDGC